MGNYVYKRLNFVINAAAEKFQNVIATAISDLKGLKNISDAMILSCVVVTNSRTPKHCYKGYHS